MTVNLLFFIIFIFIGLILMFLSLVFKCIDNKCLKECNQKITGKVIDYTFWHNSHVHFPIVEYIVDNMKYTQHLKYGWVMYTASSFHPRKSKVKNDVKNENLVISKNSYIFTNPLEEHFPIGSELEVYYNPQNPKESYVMRYARSPVRKVFLFTGIGFILFAIIGLLLLPNAPIA